jgi:hypothetical protein
MKARIMERVKAVTARQWYGKHDSVATDTDAAMEDAVFSVKQMIGNGTVNASTATIDTQ